LAEAFKKQRSIAVNEETKEEKPELGQIRAKSKKASNNPRLEPESSS